jgi:prolyl 4-hydroxylase
VFAKDPVPYKHYLDVEQKLADSVGDYVTMEKERLDKLKEKAQKIHRNQLGSEYLNNPVNVYKLIKRLVHSEVFAGMRENKADEVLQAFIKDMPNEDTLSRAAEKVFKFQDEKKLDTKDMANGDIPDVKQSKIMNVDDCFHMGRMAYNNEDYYHSAKWIEEAIERLKLMKDYKKFDDMVPFLDYLSFSYYKMGNIQRAWWLTKKLLELNGKQERAVGNIGYYETEMKDNGLKFPQSEEDLPPIKWVMQKDMKGLSKPPVDGEKPKKKKKTTTKKDKDSKKKTGDKKKKPKKTEL